MHMLESRVSIRFAILLGFFERSRVHTVHRYMFGVFGTLYAILYALCSSTDLVVFLFLSSRISLFSGVLCFRITSYVESTATDSFCFLRPHFAPFALKLLLKLCVLVPFDCLNVRSCCVLMKSSPSAGILRSPILSSLYHSSPRFRLLWFFSGSLNIEHGMRKGTISARSGIVPVNISSGDIRFELAFHDIWF